MSDPRFDRAVAVWLKRKGHIPRVDPATVTKVELNYEPGYTYSSYTFEDSRFTIDVWYGDGMLQEIEYAALGPLGTFVGEVADIVNSGEVD